MQGSLFRHGIFRILNLSRPIQPQVHRTLPFSSRFTLRAFCSTESGSTWRGGHHGYSSEYDSEEEEDEVTSSTKRPRHRRRHRRTTGTPENYERGEEADSDEDDEFMSVELQSLSEINPKQFKVVRHAHRAGELKRESSVGEIPSGMIYSAFRVMAPYIALHFDSVVVLHIPGEVLDSDRADEIMHDIILLKTLGMKIVIVAGARPQIRKTLAKQGIVSKFIDGNRVCDLEALHYSQQAAGMVRLQIESKLGRGLLNAPMRTTVPVISGNFVKAIPFGVRDGVDFQYTGLVQKIKAEPLLKLLDQGNIVLLGHLGYSRSSQMFHCRSEEVAVAAAVDLKADKLIFFHNGEQLTDTLHNKIVHSLSLQTAQKFTETLRAELKVVGGRVAHTDESHRQWKIQYLDYMQGAVSAVEQGVERVHLVNRHQSGALINEICTRDGSGLMVSAEAYDSIRKASATDVPALLNLIRPLEQRGILVTRPPSILETEAESFYVFERDGIILACFQYKHYEDERYQGGASEMCCVAVAPQLQKDGLGTSLLTYFMRKCLLEGVHNAFVLTTQTSHWFEAHGFVEKPPNALPPEKYAKYNFTRKPKVYFKVIEDEKQIDEEATLWAPNRKAQSNNNH